MLGRRHPLVRVPAPRSVRRPLDEPATRGRIGSALVLLLAATAWGTNARTEAASGRAASTNSIRTSSTSTTSEIEEPQPNGRWKDALAWRAQKSGEAPSPEERAYCLKEGGAHELAVLRAQVDGTTELDPETRTAFALAVAHERWDRELERVRSTPRPDDARALALWQLARGERDAALAQIGALAPNDDGPEAALLRLVAEVEMGSVGDAAHAAYRERRARLTGSFAALAGSVDARLALFAEEERRAAEMSMSSGSEEPYEPPPWVYEAHPPEDVQAALTRRESSECGRLVAEARSVPATALERSGEALRALDAACEADVLAPEPWFELARWRNRRGERVLALQAVDAGLRRDPASAEGWALRASTADALDDARGALLSAERGLEFAPADPTLERIHVGALVRLGCLDEACVAAREALRGDPEFTWGVIATALADLESPPNAKLLPKLELALDDVDDRARLWSAAACAAREKLLSAAVRSTLGALRTKYREAPIGRAANALLDDAPNTPLWSGLARLARGDRPGAIERWLADAKTSGVDAIAARGLIEARRGHSDGLSVPALPEFAAEPVPGLPDPDAAALRVPNEAPTLAAAFAALPEHAHRVVLGRGTFVAPRTWTRDVDVVGLGGETTLVGEEGKAGRLEIEVSEFAVVRLAELCTDVFVQVRSGSVRARRLAAQEAWWVGDYEHADARALAVIDSTVFRGTAKVASRSGRLRIEDSSFVNPFASGSTLVVFQGKAELRRSIVQQADSAAPPLRTEGAPAELVVEDCRVVGKPSADWAPSPALFADEGTKARIVRTRAVELEPARGSSVVSENCSFQRTLRNPKDVPGWTAQGRAPAAERRDLTPLRVPEDAATLVEALGKAEPGRVIQLGPGVHDAPASMTGDVVLVGSGWERTALRSGASGAPLCVQSASVVLRELKLVGSDLSLVESNGRLVVENELRLAPRSGPAIASVRDGTLSFGSNVLVLEPRGIRFEVAEGGAVLGYLGVFRIGAPIQAVTTGDGVLATSIDLELRRWVDAGSDWFTERKDAKELPPSHRPVDIALDSRPDERELALRVERMRRVDEYLARAWPSGGPSVLADAVNRVYALAPKEQREEALFARLEPRLAHMARTNPRSGVEEVIAMALAGIGGSDSIELAFATTRRIVKTFLAAVPSDERVYVESRFQGMTQTAADEKAKRAHALDALAAGRGKEALALIDSLNKVERVLVLTSTQPDRIGFDKLDRLLYEGGLPPKLERRLRILKASIGALAPTGRVPLPSSWKVFDAYFEASRTGIANTYFAFREYRDSWGNTTYSTVLRPEYTDSAPTKPPRPEPPVLGSPEEQWDRWYDELEAWSR